ncbi:NTP transferase domain-containing protein [Chitinophaga sp. Cy-1792]|uniref:NTP transferase domain-containing protein n=1 Tax=Chitinophaga sp. Cy-1792 TaxID=2608339 RepID=UPI00141E70CE|nr:NTP transferase domain-containing protein [Chitinophaga sp. Cy-1792]NIG52896.1 NTP transferase domain-containing protein [Chitinophaga sp. Cy-1792]
MISADKAPLKGLLLCGGYSTRMQEDKSSIDYYGMPQWQYMVQLLSTQLPEVYISCRPDQINTGTGFSSYPHLIPDAVDASGPSAGLLSAHALQPETAWLVVACDLPLLTAHSLALLIAERDSDKAATSFISPFNHLPEPLIAIWEPTALAQLKINALEGQKQCPRKTLLSADIKILENPWSDEQFNANTPAEKSEILNKIR